MDTTEVEYQGRERTRAQILTGVQGTLLGVARLIERARAGEEADGNVRCAAYWLDIAAAELRALAKNSKD